MEFTLALEFTFSSQPFRDSGIVRFAGVVWGYTVSGVLRYAVKIQ